MARLRGGLLRIAVLATIVLTGIDGAALLLENVKCLIECAVPAQQNLFTLEDDQLSELACEIYAEAKICVKRCPDGDETWRYGSQMLISLKQLSQKCDPDKPVIDIQEIEKYEIDKGSSALGGLRCLIDCAAPKQDMLFSQDAGELSVSACEAYTGAKGCANSCPDGPESWAYAVRRLKSLKQLSERCEQDMLTETEVEGSTTKPDDTDQTSETPEDDRSTEHDTASSPLRDLRCLIQCAVPAQQVLFHLDIDEAVESSCDIYTDIKDCIRVCPRGREMWRIGKRRLISLKQLSQKCESDAIGTSTEQVAEEGKDEDSTASSSSVESLNCLIGCAIPSQQALFTMDADELEQSACEIYADTKLCVEACPAGDATWRYGSEKLAALRRLSQKCDQDSTRGGIKIKQDDDDADASPTTKPDDTDQTSETPEDDRSTEHDTASSPLRDLRCLIQCAVPAQQVLFHLEIDEAVASGCDIYTDVKDCIRDCPRGSEMWRLGKRRLISLKQLSQKCESDAIGTSTEQLTEEGKGEDTTASSSSVESLNCLIGCAIPSQQALFTMDADELEQYACEIYADTKLCVKACPIGDATWRYGSEKLAALRRLSQKCDQDSTRGGIKQDDDDADASMSWLYDLSCFKKCGSPLQPFEGNSSPSYGLVCDSFANATACIKICSGGEYIVAHYDIIYAPIAKILSEKCKPTLRDKALGPEDDATIRGLSKDPISLCASDCHTKATGTGPSDPPRGICEQWNANLICLEKCPRGDLLKRLARVIASHKVKNTCIGEYESGGGPGGSRKLEGNVACEALTDKEPDFCRRSQLASMDQYNELSRYCNWRGFRSVCEHSCCT